MKIHFAITVLAATTLLGACGKKTTDTMTDASTLTDAIVTGDAGTVLAEQMIDATGGTLTTSDGVTLDVQAGAVTAPTMFRIRSATAPTLPSGTNTVGRAYTFEPSNVRFQKLVRIVLPIHSADVVQANGKVLILRLPEGSNEWIPLGAVAANATSISAVTQAFSTYTAAQLDPLFSGASCFTPSTCDLTCAPDWVPTSCTGSCAVEGTSIAAGVTCTRDSPTTTGITCMCTSQAGSGLTPRSSEPLHLDGLVALFDPEQALFITASHCGWPCTAPDDAGTDAATNDATITNDAATSDASSADASTTDAMMSVDAAMDTDASGCTYSFPPSGGTTCEMIATCGGIPQIGATIGDVGLTSGRCGTFGPTGTTSVACGACGWQRALYNFSIATCSYPAATPPPDCTAEAIFAADTGNNRILMSTNLGATWTAVGGGAGSALGQFNAPEAVTWSRASNMLFVADTGNNRIQRLDIASGTWTALATAGTAAGQVNAPAGIAYADPGDNLYIADTGNNRIQAIRSASGATPTMDVLVGATAGSAVGKFNAPRGLALTADRLQLFVADTGNNRVQVCQNEASDAWTVVAASGTAEGQVNAPRGVFVEPSGRLWIADTGNNRVQTRYTSSTSLFTAFYAGSGPGQVSAPRGVTVLSSGDIFVADTGNNRVLRRSAESADSVTTGSWSMPTGVR